MMGLNELLTNSVKYGALSQPGGRVKITWRVERNMLHLVWDGYLDFFDEGAPIRPGFGTLVLTRIVPSNLQGKADFKIGDGKVHWELVVPLRSR
jgi:two-component sensor histidine kinase